MRAISYWRYGRSDRLELTTLPRPKVSPDGVLVRTRMAAVNPVDWKAREGRLDPTYDVTFPVVPGWDVAGVVEQAGAGITEFAPGDEVIGYVRRDDVRHGTYAELVPAPVRTLAAKPANASWAEAAGLPLAGLTALQALTAAGLTSDDVVLVHAAAGGVGHLATQLARIHGARVVGTASEPSHDILRGLGAEPVAYGDGLVERVRAVAPDGVDIAVDLVGGPAPEASFALTKDPRRVVSIVDAATVLERGGRYVYARPNADQLTRLAGWVDEGRLRVRVARTFPLAEAAAAQDLVREGHVHGKVVLEV